LKQVRSMALVGRLDGTKTRVEATGLRILSILGW